MWGRVLPFAGALLLSMLVLFSPGDQMPSGPWWADDVVHASVFALLAGTGRMLPVRWSVLAAGLVGYAALTELVHTVAPLHRSGSVWDVLADLVGLGLALLCTRGCAPGAVHQGQTHRASAPDTPGTRARHSGHGSATCRG
jgi:hypothetical protein